MKNQKSSSSIVALVFVSESEIAELVKNYTYDFADNNPKEFLDICWRLGADISQKPTFQDCLQHRNRMNQVVVCSRWMFNERTDDAWIKSGYASAEAKDKAKNSKMLDSLYRQKCMTQDMQDYLEQKDKYAVVEEVKD